MPEKPRQQEWVQKGEIEDLPNDEIGIVILCGFILVFSAAKGLFIFLQLWKIKLFMISRMWPQKLTFCDRKALSFVLLCQMAFLRLPCLSQIKSEHK